MMPMDRYVIEQAYAFFHQKEKVYAYSASESERDHIEDTIADYVNAMSPALYVYLSGGDRSYLREHPSFRTQLREAIEKMELLLNQETA